MHFLGNFGDDYFVDCHVVMQSSSFENKTIL